MMKYKKQIKIDLYEKWGPFVPEEFRNDICAKPVDAISAAVKEARLPLPRREKYIGNHVWLAILMVQQT